MALKKVRTNSSGSKSKKARYVTRAEAKGSARKHRRVEDALAEKKARNLGVCPCGRFLASDGTCNGCAAPGPVTIIKSLSITKMRLLGLDLTITHKV